MNKIVSIKTISFFLVFMLIAGTITSISVYAQQQSNSPFVTRSEFQSALNNVVTQDQLQATEDELQSSLAQLQLRQDQLQAILASTQTQLQDIQNQLQAALANVINPAKIYTVFGPQNSTPPGPSFATISIARCNTGDTILSGSYTLSSPSNTGLVISRAFPSQDAWFTQINNDNLPSAPGLSVQTFAQCLNNPLLFFI